MQEQEYSISPFALMYHVTVILRMCMRGGLEIHYGTRGDSDQTELSSGSRARYMANNSFHRVVQNIKMHV